MTAARPPTSPALRAWPGAAAAPHRDHCDDVGGPRGARPQICGPSSRGTLLAADLFSGAGGMSLGLEQAGMRVVFGADHDPMRSRPTPTTSAACPSTGTWATRNGSTRWARSSARSTIDVIAGGPPCQPFSKAGRSRMRYLVQHGVREPHDRRRDLWQSYLEIVRIARPRAVIMENVPDMALDREMFILRIDRAPTGGLGLLSPGARRRHLPLRRPAVPAAPDPRRAPGGLEFDWPAESTKKVTLGNAIRDLPPVDPRTAGCPNESRRVAEVRRARGPSSSARCERPCRRTRRPGLRPHHPARP